VVHVDRRDRRAAHEVDEAPSPDHAGAHQPDGRRRGGRRRRPDVERIADDPTPRDVSGTLAVKPGIGPHGFRPMYFYGRQTDDAKVWTSAMFITFK
jgi:hypothetical protein